MAQKINIDEIKDGMILAESVTNTMGQTILRSGIELKAKHKMLLKTWNIKEVTIKTSENEDEIIPEDDYYELARSKFNKRMKWQVENDFEKEIVEIGINELMKKLSSQN